GDLSRRTPGNPVTSGRLSERLPGLLEQRETTTPELAVYREQFSNSELTDQEALGHRASSSGAQIFDPGHHVAEPGVLLSNPAIGLQRFRSMAKRFQGLSQ